jgi:hypothetical protein
MGTALPGIYCGVKGTRVGGFPSTLDTEMGSLRRGWG